MMILRNDQQSWMAPIYNLKRRFRRISAWVINELLFSRSMNILITKKKVYDNPLYKSKRICVIMLTLRYQCNVLGETVL